MNTHPVPLPSDASFSPYVAFLDHELPRIQQELGVVSASSAQTEAEKWTELFWFLVVGLSKTKNIGLIQSVDMVHRYLKQKHPEFPLPATLNVGPERMQWLQTQLKSYRVDAVHREDYTNVNPDQLW